MGEVHGAGVSHGEVGMGFGIGWEKGGGLPRVYPGRGMRGNLER